MPRHRHRCSPEPHQLDRVRAAAVGSGECPACGPATSEPDGRGSLTASGLQILQVAEVNGEPLITALVSYRDPVIAVRCGLPAIIDPAS